MITKQEQQHVRTLLQDPRWQVVQTIADQVCDKIQDDSVVKESEWETVKTALLNEGQIRGIKRFVQELYTQASNE